MVDSLNILLGNEDSPYLVVNEFTLNKDQPFHFDLAYWPSEDIFNFFIQKIYFEMEKYKEKYQIK